mmetsp:Transcript_24028/g.51090  ORF Transcript_24028/g.51090 Transcript_24028/m.51090 type:complete len:456 (-) Transcript_24028:142-1509(-)
MGRWMEMRGTILLKHAGGVGFFGLLSIFPSLIGHSHCFRPIDDHNVVAIVLRGNLLEELLVDRESRRAHRGRPGHGRPGVPGPARRGIQRFPTGPVGPVQEKVFGVEASLHELPVRFPELEEKVFVVYHGTVFVAEVAAAHGLLEAVDRQVPLSVVSDRERGDEFFSVKALPLPPPRSALDAFLGLLLAVQIHPTDADGGPGHCAQDRTIGPVVLFSLGLVRVAVHVVDRLLQLDHVQGVDDVDGLAGLVADTDHFLVEVLQVLRGRFVATDLHKGHREGARLHPAAVGHFLRGTFQGLLENLRVVGSPRSQHKDGAGDLGEVFFFQGFVQNIFEGISEHAGTTRIFGSDRFFEALGIVEVPVPLHAVVVSAAATTDTHDVDAVGIRFGDLFHDEIRGNDGLFPPRGIGFVVQDFRHGQVFRRRRRSRRRRLLSRIAAVIIDVQFGNECFFGLCL